MASSTQTNGNGKKKMEFKEVSFDVNEIAPDAPQGEWEVSIPRGKIKAQATKEDKFPMLIVPIRLDKYTGEEEGEEFEKALGTELTVFLTFFDDTKPRAARMSKLRIRQLCEAADVDLDLVPKRIASHDDFADLISALEGTKFPAWTVHTVRRDTQETVVDIRFQKPGGLSTAGGRGDDDEEEDDKPAKKTAAKKTRRN